MTYILYQSKGNYDEFFETSGIIPKYEDLSRFKTLSTYSENFYIRNSVFRECSSSSYGGAILFNEKRILIEETTFIKCTTSKERGGAVYIGSSGKSILNKICGFECYSTNNNAIGHFFYIYVCDDPLYNNYINYSSISNSKKQHMEIHHIHFNGRFA